MVDMRPCVVWGSSADFVVLRAAVAGFVDSLAVVVALAFGASDVHGGRLPLLTHEMALKTKHLPSWPIVCTSGTHVSLASAVGASHKLTF
jgi:hypothetical protein